MNQDREELISRGYDPATWLHGPVPLGEQPKREKEMNMNINFNDEARILGSVIAIGAALVLIVVYITACTVKNNTTTELEKTKRFEMVGQKIITNTNVTTTVVKPE